MSNWHTVWLTLNCLFWMTTLRQHPVCFKLQDQLQALCTARDLCNQWVLRTGHELKSSVNVPSPASLGTWVSTNSAPFHVAAVPQVHSSTLRHIASVEIPRHSMTLTCMWAIRSFPIQLMSPVALLLLSPGLCHPFMFLVLLSSGVQNALKTSFVTLLGAPRNRQCFLWFTVLLTHCHDRR